MAKKYILKTNNLTKDNLNRLTKTTIDNAKADREEALNLLAEIKSRFPTAENTFEYSDLIKNATAVLKQIQEVNQTVIKVMSVIKDNVGRQASKKSESVDLFEGLSKLTRSDDGAQNEE